MWSCFHKHSTSHSISPLKPTVFPRRYTHICVNSYFSQNHPFIFVIFVYYKKQTNASHYLHGYRQTTPTIVGADSISARKHSPRTIPTATTFVLTYPTKYRTLFRFFLEKRRYQNRLQGFRRQPRSLPGFRCPSVRAAVCDFLPLRLCDEMGICDILLHASRPYAIGHRGCNPSFIL